MKMTWILAAVLPLALAGCGSEDTGTTQTDAAGTAGESGTENSEARLKRESDEWMKETKELGSAAWEVTKEKSAEYSEKAGDYYEDAKVKSKEYYEEAKVKSKEYYGEAKEKSKEYYEQAKVKGAEVYEDAKADMEAREGHPPAMEPAR